MRLRAGLTRTVIIATTPKGECMTIEWVLKELVAFEAARTLGEGVLGM